MIDQAPTPSVETSSRTDGPPSSDRVLTDAARRALEEADARRTAQSLKLQALNLKDQPKEIGGRSGPDPVRYGDWETGGIVSDF